MTTRAPAMSERDWQRQLTDLAELYGWTWAHFRPAQTSKGWRTAVSGPGGAGFPDLVLWRERTVFVELKSGKGRLRADQALVLGALADAGAEVYVWRPDDFNEARTVLSIRRRRGGAARVSL